MQRIKIERDFTYKNLRCLVIGMSGGYRCGYVQVPNPTQKMIKNPYSLDYSVHGGITYGEYGLGNVDEEGKYFWLGFDCAHIYDELDEELMKELNPDYETLKSVDYIFNTGVGEIRSTEYVKSQLCRLVEQIVD